MKNVFKRSLTVVALCISAFALFAQGVYPSQLSLVSIAAESREYTQHPKERRKP